MDPNRVLERLIEAIGEDDVGEVAACAHDLRGWLNSGGFAPELSRTDLLAILAILEGTGPLWVCS